MAILIIPEHEIRRHGPGHALAVLWRQWRAERALRRRGIHFRDTDPAKVEAAYAAMTDADFAGINARQDWANWRTIPRCLSGHVPDRKLRVLDLGCGSGSSTQVLAFYCPDGSHITGYELAAPLLVAARRREFRHRTGQPAHVDFLCQGVTEMLGRLDGQPLPERSVDLVNASGVVGHHLDGQSFPLLLRELQRVLKENAVAQLDVGPTLRPPTLKTIMTSAGFQFLGHYRSWFGDPTGQMVFRR